MMICFHKSAQFYRTEVLYILIKQEKEPNILCALSVVEEMHSEIFQVLSRPVTTIDTMALLASYGLRYCIEIIVVTSFSDNNGLKSGNLILWQPCLHYRCKI